MQQNREKLVVCLLRADELVTRRPSLSGTFAPAHTVQHKPMAVGAALALMN